MTVQKFTIASHTQHDEEPDEHARETHESDGPAVPITELEAFYDSNPLYEVIFDVEYDSDTRTFTIVECDAIGQTFKSQ